METDQLTSKLLSFKAFLSNVNTLELIALTLLAFVTLSVAYLSYVDWKDRRRRNNDSTK